MQNEKTTGEIEHNIPGGELVIVLVLMLVIESKVRNQRSEATAAQLTMKIRDEKQWRETTPLGFDRSLSNLPASVPKAHISS